MNEQESFFSPKHEQLLNIATWAKYLAWVVLIIFAFTAFSEFIQDQYAYAYQFQRQAILSEIFYDQPLFAANIILNIVSVLFKGVVYFLMLKGISLGLNMIVETNINYREIKKEGAHNG